MEVDKETVLKVARLAKLGILDNEVANYQVKLGAILEYANKLDEVNVDGVMPTNQVTGLTNVFREDIAIPTTPETRDRLLANVPVLRDSYIVVPHTIKKFK